MVRIKGGIRYFVYRCCYIVTLARETVLSDKGVFQRRKFVEGRVERLDSFFNARLMDDDIPKEGRIINIIEVFLTVYSIESFNFE